MRRVHFELNDREGAPHLYEVELFSCDENAALQLMVGQPAFEMVADLIGTLAPALVAGGLEVMLREGKLGDLAKALLGGNVDVGRLSQLMAPLFRTLQEQEGPVVIARIFARTVRQVKVKELSGAPTTSGDGKHKDYIEQPLGDPEHRDAAFGDGNMGEYWLAALMVLVVNFFHVGRDQPATWSDAAQKLTGGLLQP